MKAILEFDLDNPDDAMSHKRCVKSLDMAIALFEITHNCHRHTSELEVFKTRMYEVLNDNNIDIDELIR